MSTNEVATLRSGVTQLDAIKRRRRLENLLYTRKRVAELEAQHRSHGLDEALELYLLLQEIEQTIADEFPEEFELYIADWVLEAPDGEHDVASTSASCSLCKAVTSAPRHVIEPLRAA